MPDFSARPPRLPLPPGALPMPGARPDQAQGLRRLFAGRRRVVVPLAANPHDANGTRVLDRLAGMLAAQGRQVLVVNASAQGETIEDQLSAYGAAGCKGLVLSKLDEAVKLGPALDALIRHKLKVLAVANGQRVPEDWHRLSAQALVQRALKPAGGAAWQVDERDVNLIFAGLPAAAATPAPNALHA